MRLGISQLLRIPLNAFVRRTLNTNELKQLIKDTGALLTRKGRSRLWYLQANSQQLLLISELIYKTEEESWFWVAITIASSMPHLSHEELLAFAREKSVLTVTELMSATDCKLIEARKVIDQLEWE